MDLSKNTTALESDGKPSHSKAGRKKMHSLRTWRIFASWLLAMSFAGIVFGQQPKKAPAPPWLPPGVKAAAKDVEYVKNGHERNKLDIYAPEKPAGKMPLVVWIHGGGWQGGSKESLPALELVNHGYVVASINYRFSQHAIFPAQIEDCKAAIRFLRANAAQYSIDPDHVGVWGASAGGHLVALLGTTAGVKEFEGTGGNPEQSTRVQAVVDWFGPTDLLTIGPLAESPVSKLIGGLPAKMPEKARKASPMTYVGKDAAPMLIMHGDKDMLVPLNQSERFAEALKKAGAEVRLQVIHGNGHGGPGFYSVESRKMIIDFFDKHLKPAKE
jgi:acetyl esterase/lipase